MLGELAGGAGPILRAGAIAGAGSSGMQAMLEGWRRFVPAYANDWIEGRQCNDAQNLDLSQ